MPNTEQGFIVTSNGSAISIANLECICYIDFNLMNHEDDWESAREFNDWLQASGYKSMVRTRSGNVMYFTDSVEALRAQL